MIPRRSSPRAGAHPEPRTLEQLIASEGAFVARMLRRAGVLEDAVDDAVQQVFLVAARRLADVRAGSGRAFLVGVALNVAAHARRRATRRPEVVDPGWEDMLDDSPLPDDALDSARLGAVVTHALQGLPDELRAVLLLVDVEEHTMARAAELLQIPRGTVASRLRRARADLAAAVARERPSRAMRTSSGTRRKTARD
jgi:RNA polymerase sigma-70 factor, ECF subfamily